MSDPVQNRPPAGDGVTARRRWLPLGELLAVIAVLISALTLWNGWRERSENQADKQAEAQLASTRARTLLLVATESGGHELLLKPASTEQSVQSQSILFPTALGVAAAETTGEPRIDAGWFQSALKKARGDAGLPDDSRGDERLPVAITTRFLVDGEAREEVAIYDVGYTITGRWLSGHTLTLRGLSLVSGTKPDNAQHLLDARWARLFKRK